MQVVLYRSSGSMVVVVVVVVSGKMLKPLECLTLLVLQQEQHPVSKGAASAIVTSFHLGDCLLNLL